MNKQGLVDAMALKTGMTKKDVEASIVAFQEVVTEELAKGGKVQLVGFGTFEVATQKPREVRNPKDPSKGTWMSEEKQVPKFKFGKSVKDAVKGE